MGLFDFFSKPPTAPQLPGVNQIAQSALGGWATQAAAIPQFNNAANEINTGYQSSLNNILPGYQTGLAESVGNANSFLNGQIPLDVQAAVRRSGALTSLNGGFGTTSGMARNLTARDFGLTSLNLINQGQGLLDQDINLGRAISPANGGQFITTPGQFMGLAEQTAQGNAAINYGNSLRKSPFDSFLNNLPNLALQGGLSYLTGGLGAGALFGGGGNSTPAATSFNATYNPQPTNLNSFNPQLFPGQ